MTKDNTIKRFIQAGCNGIKHADPAKVTSDELRFYGEAVKAMRKHPELYMNFPSVQDVEDKWLLIRQTVTEQNYRMAYSILNLIGEMLPFEEDED